MNFSYNSGVANMLNPKVRRQKFGFGGLATLMLIGAAFMGGGSLFYKSGQIDPSWTRVTGKVVSASSHISDGSTTYTPIIAYTVNGRMYQVTSNTGSSQYPATGSVRQVAYNPRQPQQAKAVAGTSDHIFVLGFIGLGAVAFILGPILFIRERRRTSDINNLVQSGIKLQGIVSNITASGNSQNSNGASGYKIEVSATDQSGNVQNYISDSLAGIGGLAMADYRSNPIPIDVYINPSDPKDYYVDISDVPNLTPERIGQLIQQAAHRQPLQPNATPGQQPTQVAQPTPAASAQPAVTPAGNVPTPPPPPASPQV